MIKKQLLKIIKNKYILSILIFFIWLLVFDSNNLIERFQQFKKIDQLEKDKNYFNQTIQFNRDKIKELKTDEKNLEKFAREQYMMKKDSEDVFIIVDEKGKN